MKLVLAKAGNGNPYTNNIEFSMDSRLRGNDIGDFRQPQIGGVWFWLVQVRNKSQCSLSLCACFDTAQYKAAANILNTV